MESLTPPRAFEISSAQEAKGAAADEKVSALEAKLEELYKARAGRAVNAWWAWCARCGAQKVNPIRADELALVNPGRSRTTQICAECRDEVRREEEREAFQAAYLLAHPEDAISDREKELLAQARERAARADELRSKGLVVDGISNEVCPRCEVPRPNVGPWDGTGGFSRLCGGCKAVVALEALAKGRANV